MPTASSSSTKAAYASKARTRSSSPSAASTIASTSSSTKSRSCTYPKILAPPAPGPARRYLFLFPPATERSLRMPPSVADPRHAPPRRRSRAPPARLRHPHRFSRLPSPPRQKTQTPRHQKHLLHLPAILGLAPLARACSPPALRESPLHFSV